jgi:tyrosine-protein kinase Etk/Wzc
MNTENEHEFFQEEKSEPGFNIKVILGKLLNHWFWFTISLMIAITISFMYLRYQIPIYQANATVLIKDEKKGGALSELSAFSDLNIMTGSSSIDNEIEIFKSRNLMARVVRDLNLQTSYYVQGKVIEKEVYVDLPFKVIYYEDRSKLDNSYASFSVKIIDNNYFEFIEG